ncbi:hypothetical protein FRB93_006517 [Tulasnella sp. JGI-2019a]|nr:hypothetical protein FRB93_006517 [Tulasnella sp. JGI-2019a]
MRASVVDDVDGTNSVSMNPGCHTFISTIIGGPGSYVPHPGHSILSYLGPQVSILLLDGRAERTLDQVCSPASYDHIFDQIAKLPPTTEHLVILLGIPIAYPRMNFMEKALGSKFNPVLALAKNGTTFAGLTNKFNSDAELLDDLNDHWTAAGHKKERNAFVERCQALARAQRLRISFVSGDVHCAAVGAFKTLSQGRSSHLGTSGDPGRAHDPRFMLNIVTSAIVNTGPPPTVLKMVNALSEKKHKTMHGASTDEIMIPLFLKNPDGTASKHKYVYGARNYTKVVWDDKTGELEFDIRIEKQKGHGTTVGYTISAPRPLWG